MICRFPAKGFREALPNTKVHQQARQKEIGRTTRVERFSGKSTVHLISIYILQLNAFFEVKCVVYLLNVTQDLV